MELIVEILIRWVAAKALDTLWNRYLKKLGKGDRTPLSSDQHQDQDGA